MFPVTKHTQSIQYYNPCENIGKLYLLKLQSKWILFSIGVICGKRGHTPTSLETNHCLHTHTPQLPLSRTPSLTRMYMHSNSYVINPSSHTCTPKHPYQHTQANPTTQSLNSRPHSYPHPSSILTNCSLSRMISTLL